MLKSRKRVKQCVTTGINCQKLEEEELKDIYGSGNSQIRYISNEYIQARILKMRAGV